MNSSIVRYILGHVLKIEAALMVIPVIVGVIYREKAISAFLITMALCAVCGILMTIKKPANTVFYLKEGCVTTALSWILMSIFGCLPFFISREIPSFTDALFETISGFTTTGASILSEVEGLVTEHYVLEMLYSLDWWYGSSGISACSNTSYRWL